MCSLARLVGTPAGKWIFWSSDPIATGEDACSPLVLLAVSPYGHMKRCLLMFAVVPEADVMLPLLLCLVHCSCKQAVQLLANAFAGRCLCVAESGAFLRLKLLLKLLAGHAEWNWVCANSREQTSGAHLRQEQRFRQLWAAPAGLRATASAAQPAWLRAVWHQPQSVRAAGLKLPS